MSDINTNETFDRNDQDPELIAQAFAEAAKVLARQFAKIAVAGEMVSEVNRREVAKEGYPILGDLDEAVTALYGTDLDRAERALVKLGASCVQGVAAIRLNRPKTGGEA